jgi:hypothetical protein
LTGSAPKQNIWTCALDNKYYLKKRLITYNLSLELRLAGKASSGERRGFIY